MVAILISNHDFTSNILSPDPNHVVDVFMSPRLCNLSISIRENNMI